MILFGNRRSHLLDREVDMGLVEVIKTVARIPWYLFRPPKAPQDQREAALRVQVPSSMISRPPTVHPLIENLDQPGWSVGRMTSDSSTVYPMHQGSMTAWEAAEFAANLSDLTGVVFRNPQGEYLRMDSLSDRES